MYNSTINIFKVILEKRESMLLNDQEVNLFLLTFILEV